MNNNTFNGKRQIDSLGLQKIDEAFFDWFNLKLNLHVTQDDGTMKKVPIQFVSSERWHLARKEGIRDSHGTVVLPIIAISRTNVGSSMESPYNRIVADTKQELVYSKQVSLKSSLVKELNKNRKWNIDPSLPIYEIYTTRVPDQYMLTYEVSIWSSYMAEMNEIIEKIGQEYDYLSVKSFKFESSDKFYWVAFQDDGLTDESNLEDYSDSERIIRRNIVFNVPGYILPDSNERRNQKKKYLSQSKLIFKEEVALTKEDWEKIK